MFMNLIKHTTFEQRNIGNNIKKIGELHLKT